ncbi:MAG: aldose 1-epimerase family protein [Candidatus Flexifilum sp.]|jgi:hypothetical protein
MNLFGQSYTARQLEAYSSDLRQFADIRLIAFDDGQERGVRAAEIRTGSGLDFTVLLDRGMDIGMASYNGIPLAWQSGTGAADPARFEPEGLGWLRTFHGGLLALCGLTHAGFASPAVDPENNEVLGLHGRIGTIPAYDVRIDRNWHDETPTLSLHGTVDEVSLFGYKLRLKRTITFTPGVPEFTVHDRVYNFGGTPAPLMILYHCNFGYPIVSPDSIITSPALRVVPRDAVAEPGIDSWMTMHEPTPGYKEQVFWHELPQDDRPRTASIFNRRLNLGMSIEFSPSLTHMTEWKQMGFGDYTVGIEPGNCLPEGRVVARERGYLKMIAPGDTHTFTLTFRIITSQP